MSTLLTAREICERALREIGAYAVNDTAADPVHLRIALEQLDLIVAELTGTERAFMFTPATIPVSITGGQQSYDLLSEMGTSAPANGISFPVWATLEDDTGSVSPIAIVDRETFENKSDPDETGTPDTVYIDRFNTPTMKIHPTPASGTDTFIINLTVQTLGEGFATHKNGNVSTGLRAAWQRWAIFRLARDLGRGSVLRLPKTDRDTLKEDEKEAFDRLMDFENKEHTTTDEVAAFYDGV